MPDYRRTRDYQPDLQADLDAQMQGLRRWDPLSGALADRGLNPEFSDRYLESEGSKDTLGSLAEALQNAQSRTESIDAGLGRQQDLIQEQKQNLNPLFAQAQQQQEQGPGLMDRLGSGLGAIGGAVSSGLGALVPSQNTLDTIGMRLQNMGAAYHGIVPPYLQQAKIMQEMGQSNELMQMKRAEVARQIEQQRQEHMDKMDQQALGIWTNPQLSMSMRKKLSEQLSARGSVLAGNLARLGDGEVVAEMDSLQDFIPQDKFKMAMQVMKTPNADLAPVEQMIQMARERKKTFGEAKIKSERFQELSQMRNSGQLDENHPLYDEYAKHADELIKRKQDAVERDLKLQQLGLGNRKAAQEYQMSSLMPQVSEEIPQPGGMTGKYVVDPTTMQRQFIQGEKKPLVEINTAQKASEEAARKYIDKTAENYDRLRNASDALVNIEQAKELIPKAKYFMGPFGETWLEGVKLLNNRLNLNIKTDNVKSAEELRTRIFANVMDNLKKLDASPSQEQQRVLQEALGKLGTDPKALPGILDAFGDSIRRKVDQHNKEVEGAIRNNTKFPFDPRIELPPRVGNSVGTKTQSQKGMKKVGTYQGKPVYEDETGKRWIDQ